MTVERLLEAGAAYLCRHGMEAEEAQSQARILLSEVLHCSLSALTLQAKRVLEEALVQRLREQFKRIASGEPIQYVLGTWPFHNITLRTEVKTTAVPRYETDEEGNLIETEEVITIYLTIVTEHRSIEEITEVYGFSAQQKMMLDELLSEERTDMWTVLLDG